MSIDGAAESQIFLEPGFQGGSKGSERLIFTKHEGQINEVIQQ